MFDGLSYYPDYLSKASVTKKKKVLLDRHQVERFHFGVGPEIFRCCFLDDSYDLVQIFKAGSNVRNEDNNINIVLNKNVWTNDAF